MKKRKITLDKFLELLKSPGHKVDTVVKKGVRQVRKNIAGFGYVYADSGIITANHSVVYDGQEWNYTVTGMYQVHQHEPDSLIVGGVELVCNGFKVIDEDGKNISFNLVRNGLIPRSATELNTRQCIQPVPIITWDGEEVSPEDADKYDHRIKASYQCELVFNGMKNQTVRNYHSDSEWDSVTIYATDRGRTFVLVERYKDGIHQWTKGKLI